jgi:nucleotide-binding universal stress UspA family protein
MIKSILLPLDGSIYSESVLDYGKFLAKKIGAVIRVLTVIDIRLFDWSVATGADSFVPVMPSTDFQEESHKLLQDKADKVIEKASTILKDSGIQYEISKQSGIPVDEICAMAKQNDLIIMGIRGEYERWSDKLLGVTVEAVTRQISKPVLLVDKKFELIEKIMCGYDGSDTATKALQFSAYMASAMALKLQVVSVFNSDEERSAILAEAEKYLKPYQINFELRHESGDPDDVLISMQDTSPGKCLTIIGSYGHSRLREAILGSTTVQIMRKSPKPVLLAK